MAHKKGVGSSKNGRDSNANRLGLKRADGQLVTVRVWGGEIERLKAFGMVLNYDPRIVRFRPDRPDRPDRVSETTVRTLSVPRTWG